MNTLQKKPLIIFEGNIGTGKTTAAKKIAQRLNLRVIEEPVDEELLALLYEDLHRWAFPFQINQLHKRWSIQIAGAVETTIDAGYKGALIDRSPWGDLVFAKMLNKSGHIHDKELEIYLTALRNMCLVLWPPSLIVYLNARPETCLERIKQRNRPQEQSITLEYLQNLHKGYFELIKEAKTVGLYPWSHTVECLVCSWDVPMLTEEDWDKAADMIKEVCF